MDEGKESFRSLEAKLGISKSTLQRWYIKRLEDKIEERGKILADLEQRILKRNTEFGTLESRYAQKNKHLEEEYRKKKSVLESDYLAKKSAYEEELERIKREMSEVKAAFER
ncbi:MAG: hypothetical protein ACUVRA_02250 [Candidatus Bathyarchaeaceae archaeon]